jgi:hypothetical protein
MNSLLISSYFYNEHKICITSQYYTPIIFYLIICVLLAINNNGQFNGIYILNNIIILKET